MLIVKVRNKRIDLALKEFRRKSRNAKIVDELRKRSEFTKPSVIKRNQRLKAKYIQKIKDLKNSN